MSDPAANMEPGAILPARIFHRARLISPLLESPTMEAPPRDPSKATVFAALMVIMEFIAVCAREKQGN